MDEMTFRSKLLTYPQRLDEDMLEYLDSNPEQKAVVQSVREFDQQISETLDVEIPEGLHARILLRQSYDEEKEFEKSEVMDDRGLNSTMGSQGSGLQADGVSETFIDDSNKVTSLFKKPSWLYGLAASLLVMVVGINQWFLAPYEPGKAPDQFVDIVVAHVEQEADTMNTISLPKSKAEMSKLFANVGAQINQSVEGMTYAGMCDVNGEQGLHIVMKNEGKPVTLVVLEGDRVDSTLAFERSGYKGQIVPVKGGVVAIVADTMEQVALASARFFKAVKFA